MLAGKVGGIVRKKCFALVHGTWVEKASMIKAKYWAASSLFSSFFLVTGGTSDPVSGSGERLNITEYYDGVAWRAGPQLRESVYNHCQVTIRTVAYIIGRWRVARFYMYLAILF